jgi:glycosyltransferase involved in cell wall biosynthesis
MTNGSSDKLRVLVLATTFPRWPNDNEPRFVFDLTKKLAEKVSLWALVPHAPGAKTHEEIDGVRIIRFPYFLPKSSQTLCYEGGILPKLKKSWLARLQVPFFLVAQLFFIWQAVRRHKINFIHCHWIIPQGFFVALIHCFHKIPYIFTALGADVFAFKGNAWVTRLKKFALKRVMFCVVNSHATQQALELFSPQTQFKYIPNGVDVDLFHENRKDKKLKASLGVAGLFLLAVGRFAEKKGFKYLIDAMPLVIRQYPDIKLALVGFGPEETALKRQALALKLSGSVIFPGPKSGTELAAYYATADIFIGPSIVVPGGDTEGQGVVFVEALSAKAVVVATDAGGITDMIKDGDTGLIVPQKDSAAIAESVLRLCRDPSLRTRLAENGRRLVEEKYSWDTIASQYLEVYRQVEQSLNRQTREH